MNTTSQPENTSCVKKVDLKCKCFDAGNVKRLLSSYLASYLCGYIQGYQGIRQFTINLCTPPIMVNKIPFMYITIIGYNILNQPSSI